MVWKFLCAGRFCSWPCWGVRGACLAPFLSNPVKASFGPHYFSGVAHGVEEGADGVLIVRASILPESLVYYVVRTLGPQVDLLEFGLSTMML